MMVKAFILTIAVLAAVFGCAMFELAGEALKREQKKRARGFGLVLMIIAVVGLYIAGGI